MSQFHFYYPIQVRFGDLDAQGHVNNARFFTYIEAARFAYYLHLDLFDGKNFQDLETIIADVHLTYLASITIDRDIQVGVLISRLGSKSMDFLACIEDRESGQTLATCKTITVAYNYRTNQSKPISDRWRRVISEFEGIPPGPTPPEELRQ